MAEVRPNGVRLHIFCILDLQKLLVNVAGIRLGDGPGYREGFILLGALVVDLPEQPSAATAIFAVEVDVDVVVLAAHRLLDKGLGQRVTIYPDGVVVVHHLDLLGRWKSSTCAVARSHKTDASSLIQLLGELC